MSLDKDVAGREQGRSKAVPSLLSTLGAELGASLSYRHREAFHRSRLAFLFEKEQRACRACERCRIMKVMLVVNL